MATNPLPGHSEPALRARNLLSLSLKSISPRNTAWGCGQKLMPFAGEKVTVSGKVFQRSASKAIVIEKIERVASSKAAPVK